MDKINPARNFFLHLLQFLTFFWSMITITTILFQYVNTWVPDILSYASPQSAIRWAVSGLVVAYPVFVAITRFFRREGIPNPKFAVYFTLFIAGITIIADVGTVVYQFLGGDLTLRFGLKILAVFLVAAFAFFYFLWDLKRNGTISQRANAILWSIDVIVLAIIIGAFIVVGSPQKQRAIRFDNQRVSELQQVQWQIINYWQTRGELPLALEVLNSDLSGFRVPNDPETKQPYEYAVLGKKKFELCATFSYGTDTSSGSAVYPYYDGTQSFDHEAGRDCFEREIDEKEFPVNKPAK